MNYLRQHGTRQTPQRERMRADQIENSEGGYVWALDPWARLRRFLILGSEGGSFYASERELTFENVECVRRCVADDGVRAVREIVEVSEGGAAAKNDPALFALATAISLGDEAARRAAAEALPRVARIGTHLYHFVAYAETMRGWGRTLRWAVANWYDSRDPEKLAYDAVKYRQRDGWSHRDLIRLARASKAAEVLGFVSGNVGHERTVDEQGRPTVGTADWAPGENTPRVIEGFLRAQEASSPSETARLVREYRLPREALLPGHLNDRDVWAAMLENGMPLTALVRNLATMTRVGVLSSREHMGLVTGALSDPASIRRARVHPVALLLALRTYASGVGFRGRHEWTPVMDVTDALDGAFYLAFDNVEATGKRILLGVDVSGSMNGSWGGVAGSPLTPRDAAAAMALVTVHAEPSVTVVGFTNRMHTLSYSRRQRLDDALAGTPMTGEGTDCAIPVVYAMGAGDFDAIVLYTDNETWAGPTHVSQAIRSYREQRGIPTRMVACGMVANEFTVCDPTDPLSLDVAGFNAGTPRIISEFAGGSI